MEKMSPLVYRRNVSFTRETNIGLFLAIFFCHKKSVTLENKLQGIVEITLSSNLGYSSTSM